MFEMATNYLITVILFAQILQSHFSVGILTKILKKVYVMTKADKDGLVNQQEEVVSVSVKPETTG